MRVSGASLIERCRVAKRSDEYRAIGATRAVSFLSFPSDRSSDAVERHAKIQADEQWKSVENKAKLQDPGFRGVIVTALIGTLAPADNNDTNALEVLLSVTNDMVRNASGLPSGELAVSSADINITRAMPGESLSGTEGKQPYSRCYLSNVCVIPSARSIGVGTRMIEASLDEAARQGVQVAYVHCGQSNGPALSLYKRCGFEEEKRDDAKRLAGSGQEPRVLFRRFL